MHAWNLSVVTAFDLSYHGLEPGPRRLLRRLGLHPGRGFDTYTAAALDDSDLDLTGRHLGELYDHYLPDEPVAGRCQIHDLVGERARAVSAADPGEERADAIARLFNYYLSFARVASAFAGAGERS